MSLLIDTNVLLRLAQPSSADHATAREAMLKLDAEHVELCLVPQVVYKFWVAATRPVSVNGLGMDLATVEDSILRMIRRFRFFRDERGIFERWHSLVVDSAVLGKTAHDARLVAAMRRHAIPNVLTFNTDDFDRFSDIHVVSPGQILSGHVP